jgi:spoIIIJ-associated protein
MSQDDLTTLVTSLFSLLGLNLESLIVSNGQATDGKAGRTTVVVKSGDAAVLLQNSAEGLRALNALARRLAEKKYGEETANFLIDINGYHEQQLEVVRANARMLAQRARLFKHDVELPPMSSYERLVVHELFAEDPEIETRSEGEGKFRHIVLKPKS